MSKRRNPANKAQEPMATDVRAQLQRYGNKTMKLGKPEISLAISDIKASLAFYEALGFKRVEGAEEEK